MHFSTDKEGAVIIILMQNAGTEVTHLAEDVFAHILLFKTDFEV